MKHGYLIIIFLFFGVKLSAQEGLNRVWFLTYLEVNAEEEALISGTNPSLSMDTNNEIFEVSGICNVLFGTLAATASQIITSDYSSTLDVCATDEEVDFENAYFGFFTGDPTENIGYAIESGLYLENSTLTLTKDNGDIATFSAFNLSPPNPLTQESWYLDYFEVNGVAQHYPPPHPDQEGKTISHFQIFDGSEHPDISQDYTCYAGGTGVFTAYNYFGENLIDISDLAQFAMDCGINSLNSFDFLFTEQLEEKTHSYEIIEEGEGRRMIFTDEQGDRIFYENEFLNTDDFQGLNELSIFPNPTNDFLSITTGQNITIDTLHIYNSQGKLLLQDVSNSSTIDVSSLSSGLYFLKVTSGEHTKTVKFIKI